MGIEVFVEGNWVGSATMLDFSVVALEVAVIGSLQEVEVEEIQRRTYVRGMERKEMAK